MRRREGLAGIVLLGLVSFGCGSTPPPDDGSRVGSVRSAETLPWVFSPPATIPPEFATVTNLNVEGAVWNGKEFLVAGNDGGYSYALRLDKSGAIAAVNEDDLRYSGTVDSITGALPLHPWSAIATTTTESLLVWGNKTGSMVRGVFLGIDGSRGEPFDLAPTKQTVRLAADGKKYLACVGDDASPFTLLIDPAAPAASIKHSVTACGLVASNGGGYLVVTPSGGAGIGVLRIDVNGAELGNATIATVTEYPVALASDGSGYLVLLENTSNNGLYGQRLAADGSPVGGEFLVGYFDAAGFNGVDLKYGGGNYYAAWTAQNSKYKITVVHGVPISTTGQLLAKTSTFPAVPTPCAGDVGACYGGAALAFDGTHWLIASLPGYSMFATNTAPVGEPFQIEKRRTHPYFADVASFGNDYLLTWTARTQSTLEERAARIPLGTDPVTLEPVPGLPSGGDQGDVASDGRAYIVWGRGWPHLASGPWSFLVEGTTATPLSLPTRPESSNPGGGTAFAGAPFGGYAYVANLPQPGVEDGWSHVTVGTLDTYGKPVAAPVELCDPYKFCGASELRVTDKDYAFFWWMRNAAYSGNNAYFAAHVDPQGHVTSTPISDTTVDPITARLDFSAVGSPILVSPSEMTRGLGFNNPTPGIEYRWGFELSPSSAGVLYSKLYDYKHVYLGTWSSNNTIADEQLLMTFDDIRVLGPVGIQMATPGSYLLVTGPNELLSHDFEVRFMERGRTLHAACTASWQCLDGSCRDGTCAAGGGADPDPGMAGAPAGGAPADGAGGTSRGGSSSVDAPQSEPAAGGDSGSVDTGAAGASAPTDSNNAGKGSVTAPAASRSSHSGCSVVTFSASGSDAFALLGAAAMLIRRGRRRSVTAMARPL